MSFGLIAFGLVEAAGFSVANDGCQSGRLLVLPLKAFLNIAVIVLIKRDLFILNGFLVYRQLFNNVFFDFWINCSGLS